MPETHLTAAATTHAGRLARRLALIAVLSATPLAAHPPMSHDCIAPVRPADDQDDVLWQAFLDDIEGFQACVNEASDRQLAAAAEHQAAARSAVGAWNTFVRTSLNAPADYPWPPQPPAGSPDGKPDGEKTASP